MTQSEIDRYWSYTYLFDIVKNVCFVVALWIHKPRIRTNDIPFLDMDFNHTTNP